ncbi:benenodin family lasso peptide [Novosphingobium sp. RL4]|nr:benenodin family lasso peptide [Novosphingobium sp. RL4]WRT94464.1 benenodin family lasso peptide [Novosphingobium sp. RL4]
MEREDDTIELGAASIGTKGSLGEGGDMVLCQNMPGLSDD